MGYELTTLVVIGTDCIGSIYNAFPYHVIVAITDLKCRRFNSFIQHKYSAIMQRRRSNDGCDICLKVLNAMTGNILQNFILVWFGLDYGV